MPRGAGGYSGLLPVTLVLSIASTSRPAWSVSDGSQPVCRPGVEFWSTEKAGCIPCTVCEPEFTLSPCAVHKDAICGPLSALELDWSFLSTRKRLEKPRRTEPVTSKMIWRFPDPQEPQEGQVLFSEETSDSEFVTSAVDKNTHDLRERWNTETNLPWDWQTGALILAVCACIIFFLVAGCSALVYARQWRRMKKNFEPAGLEEISTRLNLMVKAELAELATGAPINPGDPETRCQYLEKLLDRKRETPVVAGWPEVGSNLYIEEGETPSSRHTQIARIHRNIESILSHKPLREC